MPKRRFTVEQIVYMLEKESNVPLRKLAEKYDVSFQALAKIRSGKCYKKELTMLQEVGILSKSLWPITSSPRGRKKQ